MNFNMSTRLGLFHASLYVHIYIFCIDVCLYFYLLFYFILFYFIYFFFFFAHGPLEYK